MTQRAFVRVAGMTAGFNETPPRSGVMVIDCGVDYRDFTNEVWAGSGFSVDNVPDASVREILNAVILTVIANQPTGFDLVERDIIIQSLDRG